MQLKLKRGELEEFVIAVIRRAAVELEAYAAEAQPDAIDSFLDWVRNNSAANAG